MAYPAQARHGNKKLKNRTLRKVFILFLGMMGLLTFWGMKATQPEYSGLSVSPHFLTPLETGEVSLTPDPLKLSDLPDADEDTALKAELLAAMAHAPDNIITHLYYQNLKTGKMVSIRGDEPAPAASVIKLPVLLDYFRAMGENQRVHPNDMLLYDYVHQAGGSGELGYKFPGFQVQSLQLATSMIQISDNTATNMFLDHLGGMDELNDRFQRMGLMGTSIHNWLPDLEGTNKMTPRSMAKILYNIGYTRYLCDSCRLQALQILEGTHNRRLIPAALPPETVVAHKTGDIGAAIGDSALVILPEHNNYLLSIQVERSYNSGNAKPLLVELSRIIYNHQALPTPIAENGLKTGVTFQIGANPNSSFQ